MTISVRKADFSEIFKIRDLASVTIPTSYQNNLTTEQIDYLEDFLYAQRHRNPFLSLFIPPI